MQKRPRLLVEENKRPGTPEGRRFAAHTEGEPLFGYGATPEEAISAMEMLVDRYEGLEKAGPDIADAIGRQAASQKLRV